MNLIIKYSIFEELREAINLLRNPDDYMGLRSVISPNPNSIITFAIKRRIAIKRVKKLWFPVHAMVNTTFSELGLRDLGSVTCCVHGISCEGWFSPERNSIHVRVTADVCDKELLDTTIHEIVHLMTYDKKHDYHKREEIVNDYLSKPQFKQILLKY